MDDQTIIDNAAAAARSGCAVDLDTIPERLWPAVCDAIEAAQHERWRAHGWDVRQITCDKGCCPGWAYCPPGRDPASVQPHRCMRGVKHVVLSSFRECQARRLREDAHDDAD